MLKEINEKINLAKEQQTLREVLEKKLIDNKDNLVTEDTALKELEISLKKENKDVEKLQKFTITSVFATLLKTKEEKLDKEVQEYLAAKFKYDEQFTKVQLIKENIKSLEFRIAELNNSETIYIELVNEKVRIIKEMGYKYDIEMMDIMEKEINELILEETELIEALRAGDKLINEIKAAEEALSSAQGWGIWDIAGGDLISSMVKHNRLEESNVIMKRISNLLKGFNKELEDISITGLQFSGLTIAFDLFFDNIFTDFAVQNKINDAFNNVVALKNKVNNIISNLEVKKRELENTIVVKKQAYENIIVSII